MTTGTHQQGHGSTIVVDAHQHMGPWPFTGRWGDIGENLRLNDLRGISLAVVSSTRAIVQDMATGNAELAAAMQDLPQIRGYVTLNPAKRDRSVEELARYGQDRRFVGVKIHTHYSGCGMADPRVGEMLRFVARNPMPVLIHTWGAADVAALGTLADRFQELAFIAAHAGGDAWRECIEMAATRTNVYLDFCCSTPYSGAIERALSRLGAARVVFGSDATLFDPLYSKARFDALDLTATDRALVMGGNALRLFGIDAPQQ